MFPSMRATVIFLLLFLSGQLGLAGDGGDTSAMTTEEKSMAAKPWSAVLNISRATSLYNYQDGTAQDSFEYMGQFVFKIQKKYSISIQGGYSQALKYPEASDMTDTAIAFVWSPQPLNDYALLGYKLGAGIPTSKDSHTRQNSYGTLSTGVILAGNPKSLPRGLGINGSISLGRGFHQFATAIDGRLNAQYSLTESLAINYGLTERIAVAANLMHRTVWSYQYVQRNLFETSGEINYQISRKWALGLGLANSGSTLKPNGRESNIQFISETTSIAYASLAALF